MLPGEGPPTRRQLRYLELLAVKKGRSFPSPESFEQASRAIQTLKDTPPFTNRYVKL